jgi:RNA polymerase sigma factor (TIGR02999 family)
MSSNPPDELTHLLESIRAGDADAEKKLIAVVYQELHRVAVGLMRDERVDHTLQPTALVHEAYIRLANQGALTKADSRRYFFASAARAMRQILVEHARSRDATQRGGDRQRVPLDAVLDYFEEQNLNVPELHEALNRLECLHKRQGQVVTLHFFGGLSWQEVADQLHISPTTARSDFRLARAWLHKELGR